MNYFLDTSALVKVYHDEPGSDAVRAIYLDKGPIKISDLCRLEFVSAITRRLRLRDIDEATYEALMIRFNMDTATRFDILHFSSIVMLEAGEILRTIGISATIRTLDALQFAFFRVHCEQDTVFVCSDARLITAVESAGYQVFNPGVSTQ